MKRSKLVAEQEVFQLETNLDSQREKLKMEQLKNKELIQQLEDKYTQSLDKCVKMSKLEFVFFNLNKLIFLGEGEVRGKVL